jgi:hypothetical protein
MTKKRQGWQNGKKKIVILNFDRSLKRMSFLHQRMIEKTPRLAN